MTEIEVTEIPRRQRCINKNHPYDCGARDVYDDELEKSQEEVNQDVLRTFGSENDPDSVFGKIKAILDSIGQPGGIAPLNRAGKIVKSLLAFEPDEEDITDKLGKLKLKDKEYDFLASSGMGRVYLRKNLDYTYAPWVSVRVSNVVYLMHCTSKVLYGIYNEDTGKGLILLNNLVTEKSDYNVNDLPEEAQGHYLTYTENAGVYTVNLPNGTTITSTELNQTRVYRYEDGETFGDNILTQNMITKENTIHHIQYDYDLDGETISLPANCTLLFEGGSLRNGTLVLNGAEVNSYKVLVRDDLTISGNPADGTFWFNGTIPVWRKGDDWVDATGNIV